MAAWRELPHVKPVLEARLQELSASFPECVETFKDRGPFRASQLSAHLRARGQRAVFPSASDAVLDAEFVDAVRDLLRHWRVGTRATALVSSEAFRAELADIAPKLAEFGTSAN